MPDENIYYPDNGLSTRFRRKDVYTGNVHDELGPHLVWREEGLCQSQPEDNEFNPCVGCIIAPLNLATNLIC